MGKRTPSIPDAPVVGPAIDDPVVVWAAGGVIERERKGRVEALIVHRPRYDDWTFPKGKLDDGETLADAAQREVEEETGLRCELDEVVGTVRYHDNKGRSKAVVYWRMSVAKGEFEANDEVDEVQWCRLDRAGAWLTYAHDQELLAVLLGR